jgi:type IV secretion system protein VirB5
MMIRFRALALCLALASAPARATLPVIDVSALLQLQQQMMAWSEQLRSMGAQLTTMQRVLSGQTGPRGMELLATLTASQRNYLPANAADLASLLSSPASAGGGVGGAYLGSTRSMPVLAPGSLANLAARDRLAVSERRQTLATESALMQASVEHAASRFAALQSLIDAIPSAADAKAIADLQTRVTSEQTMLLNEQVKLLAMRDWAATQVAITDARRQETIAVGHGSFATRFQPKLR